MLAMLPQICTNSQPHLPSCSIDSIGVVFYINFVFFCIQIRYRAESVSANEIANGILSSLVAITAGCAFVEYWGACLIGCEHFKENTRWKVCFAFHCLFP